MHRLIETLLLPPASTIVLLLAGAAMRPRWPRAGRAVQVFALAVLWIAATPLVGGLLLGALQDAPALPAAGELPAADAIVVLAAEADREGSEFGGPVAGAITLQRLRYAARLQRRTGLPLLCSGGAPATGAPSLAAMMARAAREEFGVPVRWLEERSANTRENAAYSAELLRAAGCRRVLLVTSAWHVPRARACFAHERIDVVPAPTAFRGPAFTDWTSLVPRWSGLRDTNLALHEFGGRIAYWLAR